MRSGDLCRTRHVTAFYTTFRSENHDSHGELYPTQLLMYLGETYEDFSKVIVLSSGKIGWMFGSFLETL